MHAMVCLLPVNIQHSDRRWASIEDKGRAAFKLDVTNVLS